MDLVQEGFWQQKQLQLMQYVVMWAYMDSITTDQRAIYYVL